MSKFFVIFIFIANVCLLILAINQSFVNRIKQDKYFSHLDSNSSSNSVYRYLFLNSDRWRYGDLYGISYLSAFKKRLAPFKTYTKATKIAGNSVLYIIGDSFLADKKISHAFNKFENVIFIDRRFPFGSIVLDSTKKNYLLIEFAERNLIEYKFDKDKQVGKNTNTISTTNLNSEFKETNIITRGFKIIFNKELSRNIDLLVFDHKWATPFKEAKAYINFKLFGRTANEVSVSTDKTRLFLSSTTNINSSISAFKPIKDIKIDSISIELNKTKKYYKQTGFEDVYLAIIPNPVSLYDIKEKRYNNLLKRVEVKTELASIKTFDLYTNTDKNLFYISDSHWNPDGLDLWIKTSNVFFNQYIN